MTVSDFELMAYVDDELDEKDRLMVAREIVATEALSRQACELQSLKEMLRTAYNSVPKSSETPVSDRAGKDKLWPLYK